MQAQQLIQKLQADKEKKKLEKQAEEQRIAKEKEERRINRELKKQKNLAKKQKAAAKLKEENDVFAAVEVGMANGIASVSQQVPGSGMARFFGK